MNSISISGRFGEEVRSDCRVSFAPKDAGGIDVSLHSTVKALYGDSILKTAGNTLSDLNIKHCFLKIEDGGALPFVISARIEAAVKGAFPELKLESLPDFKPCALYKTSRNRFRRSRLYIPGDQPKLMLNAGIHRPDGIILDLEDSVAPSEKPSARLIVRNALRVLDFFGAERMVRINQGGPGLEELAALLPHNPHMILIPKAEEAEYIIKATEKISEAANKYKDFGPVFLMPIIESAKGVENAYGIASASELVVAIAIGLEDYTADIGAERTKEGRESFYARSAIVNAAKAAGVQAIDTVFSNVDDKAGLRASVQEAKALGFEGKGCIHPRQIAVVHEAFKPSEVEVEKAKQIVLAYEAAKDAGQGVVSLGSGMIDPPVVKRALKTVEAALDCGMLESSWRRDQQG